GRNLDLSARTHRGDVIVLDDDGAILNHLVALHGDEARTAQRECSLWSGHGRLQVDGNGLSLRARAYAAPIELAGKCPKKLMIVDPSWKVTSNIGDPHQPRY